MKNLEGIILAVGALYSTGCKDPEPDIRRTVTLSSFDVNNYCYALFYLEENCSSSSACSLCTPGDTISIEVNIGYTSDDMSSAYYGDTAYYGEEAPAEEIENVVLNLHSLASYDSYNDSVELLDSVPLVRDEEYPYTFVGSFIFNEYNVNCEDDKELEGYIPILFYYLSTIAVTYSIPVEDYYTFKATKEIEVFSSSSSSGYFWVYDQDCRE